MKIIKLSGKIKLLSGLHIGGGDDTMRIGGVDNQVVKDANSDNPYIPGSSLKGKMRSLLEWHIGVVNLMRNDSEENGKPLNARHIWKYDNEEKKFLKDEFVNPAFQDEILFKNAETLLKLFGDKEGQFSITRISVGDCPLDEASKKLKLSEAKYENVIDRQNGTAEHPRQTERVPAGVEFALDIRVKVLEDNEEEPLKAMVEEGLALVQKDYLGGNGSRGYGRVEFVDLKWE